MSKSLIGLIITIIGLIIIFATIYMNQATSMFDTESMQMCYMMLVIGGILVMIGTFILTERLRGWARR